MKPTTETRLQRLEAVAPQNNCPHSHEVVKILTPDSSDSIENEFPKVCECGAEMTLFKIQIVAATAADVARAKENQ